MAVRQRKPYLRRCGTSVAAALMLGAAVLVAGWQPIGAQDTTEAAPAEPEGAQIAVELNRLKPSPKGCLFTFIMKNTTKIFIEDLGLEVVLFDSDGRVERTLVLSTGSLPGGKTRVKQFDLENIQCTGLSQVLINDVTNCKGEGLDAAACLKGLSISSREDVKLTL